MAFYNWRNHNVYIGNATFIAYNRFCIYNFTV